MTLTVNADYVSTLAEPRPEVPCRAKVEFYDQQSEVSKGGDEQSARNIAVFCAIVAEAFEKVGSVVREVPVGKGAERRGAAVSARYGLPVASPVVLTPYRATREEIARSGAETRVRGFWRGDESLGTKRPWYRVEVSE